jgi:hypothetical protein
VMTVSDHVVALNFAARLPTASRRTSSAIPTSLPPIWERATDGGAPAARNLRAFYCAGGSLAGIALL